ncbi:MAG TPA: hypothetical protein DER40_04025 [Geobacter sp.]|nr:hypothetical protein [Geobacter sp.]HCE66706.1 hypothetical protein [Geobacter sp.]
MVLSGSATYQFFLNGLQYAFLHSSNAALSGSSQQGSDNQMLYALVAPGSDIATDIGSWDSDGYGWDKSSDANIQVFGTPVPEPGTVLLLGLGLVGIAGIRRRFKK